MKKMIPVFALLFAFSISFFGLGYGVTADGTMPKIRVAPDGRSFETSDGNPFVPFGVNYFRPGGGWAPQFWKQFDEVAYREDFALLKKAGVNCVRVFLTYGSFLSGEKGVDEEGLQKFEKFLDLAEDFGIYVHPTGPDHWEGFGRFENKFQILDRFSHDDLLEQIDEFWAIFADRFKGRNVLFAYDLLNEPEIYWDAPSMIPKWNRFLQNKYQSVEQLAKSRQVDPSTISWGNETAPADFSNQAQILDYQHFREEQAEHWTKRQVEAIKGADPEALVTIGLIQWAVPIVLPGVVGIKHYAGFRPSKIEKYLDFMEFHFYPLAAGFYDYTKAEDFDKNLSYVEAIAREVAAVNKPVIVAEFGWYGGGQLQNSNQNQPAGSEEDQAKWDVGLIRVTEGLAAGWLHWGFFDMPEAMDISELLGLYTVDRQEKAWGKSFHELSTEFQGKYIPPRNMGERPTLDWDLLISQPGAGADYQKEYHEAFMKDEATVKIRQP